MMMSLPGIALALTGPSEAGGFCVCNFLGDVFSFTLVPLQCWGASEKDPWVPLQTHQFSMHPATSSGRCSPVIIQLLGLLFLLYVLCSLLWSLLHFPKPSMNKTKNHSFLPLALYKHQSFPDGMGYSSKPPACQNFQTRAGTRLYVFICPRLQGTGKALQTAPFQSLLHSMSITGEENVCWLTGQHSARCKMSPLPSF